MYIAPRLSSSMLNSFLPLREGHLVVQAAQPVHLVSSTKRAFLRMVAVKLPTKPDTFSTLA